MCTVRRGKSAENKNRDGPDKRADLMATPAGEEILKSPVPRRKYLLIEKSVSNLMSDASAACKLPITPPREQGGGSSKRSKTARGEKVYIFKLFA